MQKPWKPQDSFPADGLTIDPTVRVLLAAELEIQGLSALKPQLAEFRAQYREVYDFIRGIGQKSAERCSEPWVASHMRFGAVLGYAALAASGYQPYMKSSSFDVVRLRIETESLMDLEVAALCDPQLAGLLEDTADIIDPTDEGGLAQVFRFGAGGVREFIGQALADAA